MLMCGGCGVGHFDDGGCDNFAFIARSTSWMTLPRSNSSAATRELLLSECLLYEMFAYSRRQGHADNKKLQKSLRMPNHPVNETRVSAIGEFTLQRNNAD